LGFNFGQMKKNLMIIVALGKSSGADMFLIEVAGPYHRSLSRPV